MFTGIIEYIGRVVGVRGSSEKRLHVETPQPIPDIQRGESIALDGICLTVESYSASSYTCYASSHTVRTTTLRSITAGKYVNIERALLPTMRLGGHFVTGHVDDVSTLIRKQRVGDALALTCSIPKQLQRYIVEKGSITVQGISLTVSALCADAFVVTIIPETQNNTTVQYWNTGEILNIEVDILAKYTERLLHNSSSLTEDTLQQWGFMK